MNTIWIHSISTYPISSSFAWEYQNYQSAADSMAQSWPKAFKPILRSKGFCWVDSEPFRAGPPGDVDSGWQAVISMWWECHERKIGMHEPKTACRLKVNEWSHAGRSLSVLPEAALGPSGPRNITSWVWSAKDWWWSVLKPDQLNFQICQCLRALIPNSLMKSLQVGEAPWFKKCTEVILVQKVTLKGFVATSGRPVYEMTLVEEFCHLVNVIKHLNQEPWGDRRQEIVFIGGPCMRERDITRLDSCRLELPAPLRLWWNCWPHLPSRILDDCLLSDSELEEFRESALLQTKRREREKNKVAFRIYLMFFSLFVCLRFLCCNGCVFFWYRYNRHTSARHIFRHWSWALSTRPVPDGKPGECFPSVHSDVGTSTSGFAAPNGWRPWDIWQRTRQKHQAIVCHSIHTVANFKSPAAGNAGDEDTIDVPCQNWCAMLAVPKSL